MIRQCFAMALMLSAAACATSDQQASRDDIAQAANALLRSHYRADRPGAAVLVARGDEVLFRGARGEADLSTHAALRPDAMFRIGSVTKQFTAAAVLTLVEDGRVSLSDPVSRYIPDFPAGAGITIEHLLNHTSGLGNYNETQGYGAIVSRDLTTTEIIDLFRDQPPEFGPGENWAYSNSGYMLLGAVIERVTGMAWHEYMAERFFRPLGMRHTGYAHNPQMPGQVAQGMTYDGETPVAIPPMSMTQPHAAGALVSNVDDLLTWNRALHEGRILRTEAYTRMITPMGRAAAEGIGYGFGFYTDSIRDQAEVNHGGRIRGYIATLSYVQGPDISVVILENDDARTGVEESHVLSRRLTALALGEPYPEATPVAVDAAALQALEGVYGFDGDVTRILRMVDGALTAQRGAGPQQPLTPIAADTFLYPDGFNRLQIERDAAGAVSGVRFFRNGDGAGDRGVFVGDLASAAPAGVTLPRAALERLVGAYANSQLSIAVTLEGDVLMAQIEGQPAFRLVASSATQFEVEGAGAAVEFSAGASPAAELTVRQGGRETALRRVP